MANKKVNQLTSKPAVNLTDLFLIADPTSGQAYKTTISDLGTAIGSGVSSVNSLVGAVVLDTDDIQELASPTNKWFTDTRARAALSASSPLTYNSGTGAFGIQVANGSQNGYLSSADWTTFNAKQAALSGTGFVKSTGGTISYDTNTYLTTSAAASTYLALSGGTLTGALNGTSATFNGDLTLSATNPRLYFTDTDNNPDYFISNTDGTFTVYDVTNSTSRFTIGSTGNGTFGGNLTVGQIIRSGGTSAEFLKADGSVDSSTYLTTSSAASTYLALTGGNLTGTTRMDGSGGTAESISMIFNTGINRLLTPVLRLFGSTNVASNYVELFGTLATQNRTINFPDASGTVALTSDLSSYLPLAGGTLTGALSGTSVSLSSSVTATRLILSGGTPNTGLYFGHTDKVVLANYTVGGGIDFETNGGNITMQLSSAGNLSTSGTISSTGGFISNRTSSGNANGIILQTSGTSNWYLGSSAVGANSDLQFYNHAVAGVVFNIANSSGAATFSSSVTATGGLVSNGGAIGYGGGELGFGVTTSGATSGIYTLATGSPILYFDHRATGNTGYWVWRSGTGGATTALTLSSSGAATFSSTISTPNFISSDTEFRLGAAFSRVATLDAGSGFGGGYNLNWNNASPVHNSTGALSGYGYTSGGSVNFYANSSAAANTAVSPRMTITTAGNVGIGTTSTGGEILTVYRASGGGVEFQNSTTGTGAGNGTYVGNYQGDAYFWNYENYASLFGTNNTERMRITSGGVLVNAGGVYDTGASVPWIARQGGNDRIISDGNGYVYMPFITTGSGIDDLGWWGGSGSSYGYNGMLMRISSSQRYKKNIRNLELDTTKIFDLRTISFENNELTATENITSFGLLAEDVAEKIPMLASYNAEGEPEGVQYKMLAVLLLEEMKKMKSKIETLENK